MNASWTEPLDELHAESRAARSAIRRAFSDLRDAVARWEPAPYEPEPEPESPHVERVSNADWMYGDDPLINKNANRWFR